MSVYLTHPVIYYTTNLTVIVTDLKLFIEGFVIAQVVEQVGH